MLQGKVAMAYRPSFEWMRLGAKYRTVPRVLAVIALMLLTLPSYGEERVRIPGACREVADRAGLPLTLSPGQAKRAIAYLRIMNSQDPAVARCRLALPR
jgi:hypothetical protein